MSKTLIDWNYLETTFHILVSRTIYKLNVEIRHDGLVNKFIFEKKK